MALGACGSVRSRSGRGAVRPARRGALDAASGPGPWTTAGPDRRRQTRWSTQVMHGRVCSGSCPAVVCRAIGRGPRAFRCEPGRGLVFVRAVRVCMVSGVGLGAVLRVRTSGPGLRGVECEPGRGLACLCGWFGSAWFRVLAGAAVWRVCTRGRPPLLVSVWCGSVLGAAVAFVDQAGGDCSGLDEVQGDGLGDRGQERGAASDDDRVAEHA